MGKMKIEIRKPQHMVAKEEPKHAAPLRRMEADVPESLPTFFIFLLWMSYALCGLAIWFVAQTYITR